ncbi:hypothetical protein HF521_006511, partial [Silurus meridionalis]
SFASLSALSSSPLFCSEFSSCLPSWGTRVIASIALERSLQNVANYLIGSLAITDLMVSVLVLPMAALYQVLDTWTLGQKICDLFIALDVLCCTSSILHLCAIALDRYWTITDPIDYVNKRTPKRAAVLISLTWTVGFSISIPLMLGWRKVEDRSEPNACSISQDPVYTVYSTFGAFYLPLIFMLVLYGCILRAARFHIRKNAGKRCSVCARIPEYDQLTVSFNAHGVAEFRSKLMEMRSENHKCHVLPLSNASLSQHEPRRSTGTKRKTLLAIIIGTFILCWLRFFTVVLVLPFCKTRCSMPDWLVDVINWLSYSNSLLNPVIYTYFNKDFQNTFKKMLK